MQGIRAMWIAVVPGLLAILWTGTPAAAVECPGNPNALGTSRVIVVDPSEHTKLGTMQYHETLPLRDHEVVLTFDDGPLPRYTNRILETLAAECVKATYFLVGRQARAFPETVRRIFAAGHTIGTHSQNHPLTFNHMPLAKAEQEIDEGIASVTAALGDATEVAPFFRIPGLLRAEQVEDYLASRSIMTWSADFPADDWKHLKASEIMHRALMRLEAKGKGVLLLHDIQPATALALPGLLQELKRRGYRIVHIQPTAPDRPKTPTTASQWRMHEPKDAVASNWPPIHIDITAHLPAPVLPAPGPRNFGIGHPFGPKITVALPIDRPRIVRGGVPPQPLWPRTSNELSILSLMSDALLPAPSPQSLGLDEVLFQPASLANWRSGTQSPVSSASTFTSNVAVSSDIKSAIKAPPASGPATTANMPKAGFP